jgi:hypothetical protein
VLKKITTNELQRIPLAAHALPLLGRCGPAGLHASKLTFESASDVYLNIDETNGIGELAMEDEEYAAGVMRELSPVLAGIE